MILGKYISYAVSLNGSCLTSYVDHRDIHSFPTRRSSDLFATCRRNSTTGRRRTSASRRPRSSAPSVRSPSEIGRHTSELQSHSDLVCRLLLEKKNRTFRSQS